MTITSMVFGMSLLVWAPSLAWAYPATMRLTALACATQEAYTRAQKMPYQHDREAVARMVVEKQCIVIQRGKALDVEDVTWSGLVQVRLRGRTRGWWTAIELVERKK